MADYAPKSHGITVLKHGVSRAKARKTTTNIEGDLLVSLPMSKAEEIIASDTGFRKRAKSCRQTAEELEWILNTEFLSPLMMRKVRKLANNLVSRTSAIEQL